MSALTRADVAAKIADFDRVAAEPAESDGPAPRAAAVAIALFESPAEPESADQSPVTRFLLTRRSSKLRAHPGQWALPGGRLDPGEDARTAALRELHEELGVEAPAVDILGELDDFVTRSGYLMTPVVVWLEAGSAAVVAQAEEVAEVHEIPVADLDVEPRFISVPDSTRPVLQLPLFGGVIHAPTGAILYQLAELLIQGRTTRVAHFEQPFFARQ